MTRHLRATRSVTYCGRSTKHEPSTRFHLLSTCPECFTLERIYSHLGVDLTTSQRHILAAVLNRAPRNGTPWYEVRGARRPW